MNNKQDDKIPITNRTENKQADPKIELTKVGAISDLSERRKVPVRLRG